MKPQVWNTQRVPNRGGLPHKDNLYSPANWTASRRVMTLGGTGYLSPISSSGNMFFRPQKQ